jgi:hypothetical protein
MPASPFNESAPDEPILEGIVVTLDAAGAPNVAPMGPRVDRDLTRLVLRPFQSSRTYQNLKATGCGVLHVTDDVELMAQAAVGPLQPSPPLVRIPGFPCPRLADACRWLAFQVETLDESTERTTIVCRVVSRGELRPFFGFNRAKHATIEAAILATRIGIIPSAEIRQEMDRLTILVEKTGGAQERNAFAFLQSHISTLTSDL